MENKRETGKFCGGGMNGWEPARWADGLHDVLANNVSWATRLKRHHLKQIRTDAVAPTSKRSMFESLHAQVWT